MRVLFAVVVAVLLSATLGWAALQRDDTPPQVEVRLPERIAATQTFEVGLRANEPVRYRVGYEGEWLELTGRRTSVLLSAAVGRSPIIVEAQDRAGNTSRSEYTVLGLPEVQPLIRTSRSLVPGEPFSIRVAWPPVGAQVTSLRVWLEDDELPVFPTEQDAVALASLPLGSAAGSYELRVELQDDFGRTSRVVRGLELILPAETVQNLNLSDELLAASTAENEALEAEALDAAFDSARDRLDPRWTEPFLMPIRGRDTSGYGVPRRYTPGGPIIYHEGADIAASLGTPIAASNDGVVRVAGFYPIKGGLVVIDHGAGVTSLYFHQSRLLVEVGDTVRRGDIIGEVGSTGRSTGPHLHWEMRVNAVPTNPIAWVDSTLP
ncbi:MAG: M23 family metallopeptidase [Trueperaceae bacterium]|nr:M23 family metallopeptidase [Trueperaceae bacterium]MDZ7705860.1 M23 family metallopeptidase [Trueperaceae bacterium]